MALNPLRVALTAGRSFTLMASRRKRSLPGQGFGGGQGLRRAIGGFTVEISANAASLVDQDHFIAVNEDVVGIVPLAGRFVHDAKFKALHGGGAEGLLAAAQE